MEKTNDLKNDRVRSWSVLRKGAQSDFEFEDAIVKEEPLEIRIEYGPESRRNQMPLSVTMRTPGDDEVLATGFLITEGIINTIHDIEAVAQLSENIVVVHLHPDVVFVPGNVQRHFYTTSSCGVCGKASIDMVKQVSAYRLIPGHPKIASDRLLQLAGILRDTQPVFSATGGIHAAALFDAQGELLCSKEDIGRHNAMDKLIGWAASKTLLPLLNHIVVVSGRGGFELIQKALVSGVPIFAAVGAPSSLALELAEESDMTVVGFLREDRLNVYTNPDRIL